MTHFRMQKALDRLAFNYHAPTDSRAYCDVGEGVRTDTSTEPRFGERGMQLEGELEQDSWIVSDKVNEELVFDTAPDAMWKKTLTIMGGRYSVYSNYPKDPRLN